MTAGTADTFHLDESARLPEQTIKDFEEGQLHLSRRTQSLRPASRRIREKIEKEMYAVAWPASGHTVSAH